MLIEHDTMKLEKMQEKDILQVAELLSNAFAEKFTEETGLSKETAKRLMKLLWLEEYEMFGMQPYVLKEADEVVGGFGVTLNQRKKITVSFVAKVLAAVRVLGMKQLLLFVKEAAKTNRDPDRDELYIDFIAVKESRRNQHIGHRLMEEIEQLKEKHAETLKLSLYVLKDNERARHLYTKYGFEECREHERKSYYFMVKK
ncbi:GNAT family N-acetyltransferase [Alkalibacterium sp. f15]|uniref:GNAT family N-acetyltransferase n=1 Tax=Alkalibacterium sp. f15 TaxID=3414029 RepID=UPI003BF7D584